MAKIYGLFGSMTGKLADVVMAVRNGEQVARKYQPIVSNPSTPAQVGQRAKLKLLSQLSAIMAPVIAIRRQGSVSSRNLFTKLNFVNTSFANDTASINLEGVKLTSSVLTLPSLYTERTESGIGVALTTGEGIPTPDIDSMVYCMFEKLAGGKLRLVDTAVVNEAGASGGYAHDFPAVANEVVILAYGIRLNSEAARARYGNLETPTAQTVANLLTSSTMLESDVTMTDTTGVTIAASTNHSVNPGPDDGNRSAKKK